MWGLLRELYLNYFFELFTPEFWMLSWEQQTSYFYHAPAPIWQGRDALTFTVHLSVCPSVPYMTQVEKEGYSKLMNWQCHDTRDPI